MRGTRGWVLLAVAVIAAPAAGQEVERVSGDDVAIYNLVGQVEVVRGSGSDVVVRIDRGGADASELRIETGDIDGRATLRIIYPSDEIVYPEMGRGSNTNVTVRRDGTFGDGGRGRGDRVRVSGRGGDLEAWADLVVEVPAGARFAMYQAVGRIDARGLEGDIHLDTGSGPVVAEDIRGSLGVDTGSGRVRIARVSGGNVSVDTGSGGIEVTDIEGDDVDLDTGSGGITARGIRAGFLNVDTGSGSVDLSEVLSEDIVVDTGSGSVELELLSDIDRLEVDTGSGSVTIRAPGDLGATVEIDTGSGGIDLDFPLEVRSVRRDHVEGRIGDGRGVMEIDTGSGSVRIIRGTRELRQ